MRRLAALPLLALAGAGVVTALACEDGQQADIGITEPIQVSGGQFVAGLLPGTPPPSTNASAQADAGTAPVGKLTVTSVAFQNAFLVSGIAGTSVTGLVTTDAVAVGVQLKNQGSGYWVVPVQGPDVQFPGQSDFGFSLSLNPADTPGNTDLRVVGLDASGSAGAQTDAPICILSRVPDNEHACFPKKKVPTAVFTLTWDTNFDVDLHVITPAGRDVNAKTALTSVPYDGGTAPGPTIGLIDRDSIGNCVIDGWREEDLVFQDPPPHGTYQIYAAPFASCGQEVVNFTFNLYEAALDGDLHATFSRSGQLLANDVTDGTSAGLFVAEKVFN